MTDELLRVAAAQVAPVYLNLEASVEKACRTITEAAEQGVRLVVFPESFLSGYPDWTWVVPGAQGALLAELYTRLVDNAVRVGDAATQELCAVAQRNGIHVVMGMHERNAEASDASLYNTLLFIDDHGKILGKRRKLVPTGAERMIHAQGDGSTFDTHRTPFGVLGGLICWETLIPLARQAMYEAGVQILVTPTWDKSPNWLAALRFIAREGGVFVVSCCTALKMSDLPEDAGFQAWYPNEREWINVGNSCVVAPSGEIVAGPLEAAEGLVIADIDLDAILPAKRLFDVAGHYARPDVFDLRLRRPAP